jgi:NADP-dependent 3-hydroxy acid dehydrogenase YdfG
MSASKVLLILGAGGNIGASVANTFTKNGYKVALAARSLQDGSNQNGNLQIKTDLGNPKSIESAFDKTTAEYGPPNVIVYNGK